jgi:hypothetical protein
LNELFDTIPYRPFSRAVDQRRGRLAEIVTAAIGAIGRFDA